MKELSIDELITHLLGLLEKRCEKRILIGITGAPASGKSTLSELIVESINDHLKKNISAIVPQDGFHYDDQLLREINRLPFKGAPDTFDVDGLEVLLKRLKVEDEVAIPLFDRKLEVSRNCARLITAENKLLIVEGNYLLLENHAGWKQLKPFFDFTVSLAVPFPELEKRLLQRWIDHGYEIDDARIKIQQNDLPNADTVIKQSTESDCILRS